MRTLFLLVFSVLSTFVFSQTVTQVSFSQQGENVRVLFSIKDWQKAKQIAPKLYFSTNGGKEYKPCNTVSYATFNKQHALIWSPLKDGLSELQGDNIRFKVEAEILTEKQNQKRLTAEQDYTETIKGVAFNMIYVEGGTFLMGNPQGEKDEQPAHKVTLSGYWIAETEVTQELWQAVMQLNFSKFKGKQKPMETVRFSAMEAFITKLNKLTGHTYALPTEAQWEYAAKGGLQSTLFEPLIWAGTKQKEAMANYVWSSENANATTHPAKTKHANLLGLYDMSGNVWEMCSDWYSEDFYSQSKGATDPENTERTKEFRNYRVMRGGSWRENSDACKITNRQKASIAAAWDRIGFRLVRIK